MTPRAALVAALASASLGCALASASLGCAAASPEPTPPTISIERETPPIPASAVAPPASAKAGVPKSTAIAWETNEADARARARRESRPLLVYFRAEWATAATQMERLVWTDPEIVALVRHFVPLRIDVTSAEGDAEAYAQTYGITSVPEIIVHDPRGNVTAIPGAPEAATLIAILRRILRDE